MSDKERYWHMIAGVESRKAALVYDKANNSNNLLTKSVALKAKTKALIAQNPIPNHGSKTTAARQARFPLGLTSDIWSSSNNTT
jgi:hypothetical protein